jgi:threonine dehydrogenase-like Zn-dependent dehydrogenase
MRAAAVFPSERRIRVLEQPEPQILSPSQVAIRVLEVGVCGTDREIASFRYGSPPEGEEHLIIGHEALGEVVEVGTSVHRLRPGDLVVPTVRRPCRHAGCRACRMGRPDFCITGEYVQRGIRGGHGYMAERAVDEMRYLAAVPKELRDVGVLVQPLSIAEQALMQLEDVQRRLPWAQLPAESAAREMQRRAVVLGAGPVGILGALALQVRGYKTTVFSKEARGKKSAFVESLGLGYASSREEPFEDLARRVGPIDVVYEAIGASPLAFDAMHHLGPNGVFVFTGIPGRKTAVPPDLAGVMASVIVKNQVVFGTMNPGTEAYRAAVQDLALFARRWPVALPQLVTGRCGLEEVGDLLGRPHQGVKEVVVVSPGAS